MNKALVKTVAITALILLFYLLFIKSNHPQNQMAKVSRNQRQSQINKGVLIGAVPANTQEKPTQTLLCKSDIFLNGTNDIPSSLTTTPDFKLELLPPKYKKAISRLKALSFKHGFNSGKIFEPGEYLLPTWLSKQTELEYLDLRFFHISNFDLIKTMPLKCLLLSSISISNRERVINDIKEMNKLKYLVQDDIFTFDEIKKIKAVRPNLNCISFMDYTKMIIDKRIDIDNL